jgi:hypothetical protein
MIKEPRIGTIRSKVIIFVRLFCVVVAVDLKKKTPPGLRESEFISKSEREFIIKTKPFAQEKTIGVKG